MSGNVSHAHSDDYFHGWAFSGYGSLMYYYDLPMHLDEKYTAMKNVYKGNTGDKKDFHVYAIQ